MDVIPEDDGLWDGALQQKLPRRAAPEISVSFLPFLFSHLSSCYSFQNCPTNRVVKSSSITLDTFMDSIIML